MSLEPSLRTIFGEALEREDLAERSRFLDEACAADPQLRARVEKLLRAHSVAGKFLSDLNRISGEPLSVVTEQPGQRIGRYKLLQEIGEGGCGVVYMAEQEEPVRRRVALKIIKLGMDTRSVIARFEAERQALAIMDHPNIAKVLDAAATETGRPYFVMELVRGTKITDYCDQNQLSTEQRLQLFVQVCKAVQHAHTKGIIHRDLKPGNILVTLHDGVPVPKVIDFGIAKATGQERLTDKTLFTAFEQFVGTPAYMSPEQAEMSGLDIDTRSDIYSLGVLLYELLTGQTPFDTRELLSAGLDEMRRTIREKEPRPPSTRLSTMMAGDLTTTACHRHTDPPKLIHLIKGDLDWIVMKCLEKDRMRRYETALDPALDIERHLRHEPVAARAPTPLYRLLKLSRKHKFGFAAIAGVLIALVLGFAASAWQAVRATRAEREQSRLYHQAERARVAEGRERQRAQDSEQQAQQNLYSADMHLALQALGSSNFDRARDLLAFHRHQTNLLGFEWRYVWEQSRSHELRQLRGHTARVRTVFFSPDGQTLATRSLDNMLKVWDIASGRERFSITRVIALAGFDPPGSNLLVAWTDGSVSLLDSSDGEKLETYTFSEPVGLFLAKGQFVLTQASDGGAVLRRLWTGEELLRLELLPGFWPRRDRWDQFFANPWIAVSCDGKKLAILDAGNTQDGTEKSRIIDVWDIPARRLTDRIQFEESSVTALEFFQDGAALVAGGPSGSLWFWDANTFELKERVSIHEGTVQEFAFSSDGTLLASGSADQTIAIVDLRTQKTVSAFAGGGGLVADLAFSPDGRTLASGHLDGTVKLWNAAYRKSPDVVEAPIRRGTRLVFSADSKQLVVGCADLTCKVYDAGSLSLLTSINGVSLALGLSVRSNLIAAGPGQMLLWTFEKRASIPVQFSPFNSRYIGFSVSRSGKRSAWISESSELVVWDNDAWKEIARFDAGNLHWGQDRVCFTSDDSRILMLRGNAVVLLDIAAGRSTILKLLPANATALALSPDDSIVACNAAESSIRLFKFATGEDLNLLTGHRQYIHEIVFSPDGKTLASCGNDGTVRLWNPHLAKEIATLHVFPTGTKGTDKHVWDLAFSPDGNTLAAYAGTGTLKVWRAASLEQIFQSGDSSQPIEPAE